MGGETSAEVNIKIKEIKERADRAERIADSRSAFLLNKIIE